MTDYYVAVGVNYLGHQEFAAKQYFWCTGDSMKFSELPKPLSSTCRPVFDQMQSVFTGQFDQVIVSGQGVSEMVYLDQDILSTVKIPSKGLTELDRLSHVVCQIDSDCQIIPKGAVKKTPLNEVRKNEAFRGLKADQAFSVNNYVHFRAPLLKKNIDLNARREGIYNNDFLDNAEEDRPVGTWSIQKDTLGSCAILRSKLWPGFYAFHKTNSNIYGSMYIGNGCKALDIPF